MQKRKKEEKENFSKANAQIQNKQLKNIFLVLAIIFTIFVVGYFVYSSMVNFEYRGVKYQVIKDGELTFYNTVFPFYTMTGKHVADFNVFLREDPRKLKEIEFQGEFIKRENMVVNFTQDFKCDGNGAIATANLVQIFAQLGTRVVTDENANCDSQGRYMFVEIEEGEETKIIQTGPVCYDIKIANCEILKGTEKFIQEFLVELNKKN